MPNGRTGRIWDEVVEKLEAFEEEIDTIPKGELSREQVCPLWREYVVASIGDEVDRASLDDKTRDYNIWIEDVWWNEADRKKEKEKLLVMAKTVPSEVEKYITEELKYNFEDVLTQSRSYTKWDC